MLFFAMLFVTIAFVALAPVRLATAQRTRIVRFFVRYGGALAFAAIALLMMTRGLEIEALFVALMAAGVWLWPPYKEPERVRRAQAAPRSAGSDLGEAEARAVLGVAAGASAAEIKAAFRALMRTAHPDRGGSPEAAARLVAARDRLLRRV